MDILYQTYALRIDLKGDIDVSRYNAKTGYEDYVINAN